MKKIIILILAIAISSCGPLSILGAVKTLITTDLDRRTIGVIADDELFDLNLEAWAINDKKLDNSHLNFNIFDNQVLITGEIENKNLKDYIAKYITAEKPDIKKIMNEARVGKPSAFLSRTSDSLIDGKVKLAFNQQETFNPVHIQVHTENEVVYLTGIVTKREGKKAGVIAAGVSGVKRVVKYFNYIDSIPLREIKRAKQREINRLKEEKLKKYRDAGVEFKNFRNFD